MSMSNKITSGEAGFEPTSTVLKTVVLPLNYSPSQLIFNK